MEMGAQRGTLYRLCIFVSLRLFDFGHNRLRMITGAAATHKPLTPASNGEKQ